VLQCVAVCCSVLQLLLEGVLESARFARALQGAAECCSVLQCVAVTAQVLQCIVAATRRCS